jgi:hypothetical protein
MWGKDYEYLQNKLNYSMGIDPAYVGKDKSILITVDHLGILKQTSLTNDKPDMYDAMLHAMKKIYDVTLPKENNLLTIKNTDRLTVKNLRLEIHKNPNRYDEYLIIYNSDGVIDATTFEYKQFPRIKIILKRIPNSNGTYTLLGSQLNSNNTVELKLKMEDVKNIDIFEKKLMNLISNIANN